MPVKNQAMVIGKKRDGLFTTVYELMSLDEFNESPYTIFKQRKFFNFGKNQLSLGAIVDSDGKNWHEVFPYNQHSFEYATIIGVQGDQLDVHGNKIGYQTIDKNLLKNRVLTNPEYGFHCADKLLLEVSKRIYIVHHISYAKFMYEKQNSK
jgi:hypothetical protein